MDQVGLVVPNLHDCLEHLEHLGHPLAPEVQENLNIRDTCQRVETCKCTSFFFLN